MAKNNKNINSIGKGIDNIISNIYSKTYFSSDKLSKDIENMTDEINKNLDRIANINTETTGSPTISKLYSRLIRTNNTINSKDDIAKIIGSDSALSEDMINTYLQNKYLYDYDNEIDTICKYMPKLEEALEIKKDNILSADHFSKDYLNVINKSMKTNKDEFDRRISEMKDKYNLLELIEEIYDNASKYGERFVYIVPYYKAINKLINKDNSDISARLESSVILDNVGNMKMDPFIFNNKETNINGVHIEICTSNILESVINEYKDLNNKMTSISESSITMFNEDSSEKIIPDKLDISSIKDNSTQDGFIDVEKKKTKDVLNSKFPGVIIKQIPRTNVIPIYMEDICMGYYYIECDKSYDAFNNNNQVNLNRYGMSGNLSNHNNIKDKKDIQDEKLRYISSNLSKYIDSKFIDTNQDLRKEIYMILKHNDMYNDGTEQKIRVTFIPPDDMMHVYFKKDEKTNRGISDLHKSLVPAKLFCTLYITNTIGVLTRGQDKRVYYINQSVDTNIAKTLTESIKTIKQSNFGLRQVETNMLNVTGRYNDFFIAKSPTGDSPIEFEVLQGQNIDIKTDLMQMLEDMAINSTNVPVELINVRQSIDYAIQLTMSNSKFIKKTYNRQAKFQKYLDLMVTKIYNEEYNEVCQLETTLPPPMFLNITNTNQIINNTKEYVNSILEDELATETDENFKLIYKQDLLEHYLGTYINKSTHNMIKERARAKSLLNNDGKSDE